MIFKLGRAWMSTRLSTWRRSHRDDEAEVEKRSEIRGARSWHENKDRFWLTLFFFQILSK